MNSTFEHMFKPVSLKLILKAKPVLMCFDELGAKSLLVLPAERTFIFHLSPPQVPTRSTPINLWALAKLTTQARLAKKHCRNVTGHSWEMKYSVWAWQLRMISLWLGNRPGSERMISLCQTAGLLEVMRFFYCTNLQCNALTFSPCCTENI